MRHPEDLSIQPEQTRHSQHKTDTPMVPVVTRRDPFEEIRGELRGWQPRKPSNAKSSNNSIN